MKYIESYADYEIDYGIITVPKKRYSAEAMQAGKSRVVAVEDSQLEELMKDKSFKSMVDKKGGGYRILDRLPQKYQLSGDVIKVKENKIAELASQVKDHVSETDRLRKENEELKAQLSVKNTRNTKGA